MRSTKQQTQLLRSTIHWAEKEALNYIRNSSKPPVVACEEFAYLMDEYSCKNKYLSVQYSIAKDVAMNILDQLILKGDMK